MSRLYEMGVMIKGYEPERKDSVIVACAEEWDFEPEEFFDTLTFESNLPMLVCTCSQGDLGGGEDEDEFADRLARAVWSANDAYCEVVVNAVCLEYSPSEEHVRDKAAYDKWKEESDDV